MIEGEGRRKRREKADLEIKWGTWPCFDPPAIVCPKF